MYDQEKIWQARDLVDIAYKYPNDFAPGSAWRYSNTNYVILGILLEKISNKPVKNLMENLFDKAHLNHTYYLISPYSKNIMEKMAHGYYQDREKRGDTTAIHGSWIQSGGAIVSTTNDLAQWEQYFYKSQIPFNLRNTTTGRSVTSFNEIGYSFGAFRMNTPEGLVWFTPGLTPGYISMTVYAPCLDVYFAYTTNLAPLNGLHKEMILGVLHELNGNQQYIHYLHKHVVLPDYCSKLKPANKFEFPKIG